MNILGISALYHDSAAALVVDGVVSAAAQEERFSRVKHDERVPVQAARYALEQAGLSAGDLDIIAFYDKPVRTFDRLLETQLATAPRGFGRFRKAMPLWLQRKLRLRDTLRRELDAPQARVVFVRHHESHAASAFFPSPYEEAAILTVDGVGEWATASIGSGSGNRLSLLQEQRFPHSLGLLYSACTAHCGFRVNDGEYKLMGLAPFGVPTFVGVLREHFVQIDDSGGVRLCMERFAFTHSDRMFARSADALLGGPPRQPNEPIEARHADLARSVQVIVEEAMLSMARHARDLTGKTALVLAGGVALNCVANGRLVREGPFGDVWIQPAAGDSGGALGAALFAWHQLLGNARRPGSPDGQQGSRLGPRYAAAQVRDELSAAGAVFETVDTSAVDREVAEELAGGAVVGLFEGRMEYGPRALGARSILADPRNPAMQSILNQRVKLRESFRPFAPAVLAEQAARWFDVPDDFESPYMLVVAGVRGAAVTGGASREDMAARLRAIDSPLPAVTHVDGSARVQTVDSDRAPRLRSILGAFDELTGVGVLVNTSFNVRDEPIVCSPGDAYRAFMRTEIDLLVIEDVLLRKACQTAAAAQLARALPLPTLVRTLDPLALDLTPDSRKLRLFGLITFAVFASVAGMSLAGVGALGRVAGDRPLIPALLFGLGGASALAALIRPQWNRPLWIALSLIAWPIGRVVSTLLLGLVYFGVVTPIGLLLRATGHDPLALRADSSAGWRDCEPDPTPSSYYLQH